MSHSPHPGTDDERPVEDTSAEEYHATGDVESDETGTDYNPETGEAETTPHDREVLATDVTDSDPNAASSSGLAGDMGISSERTGPADETGTGGLGDLDDLATRAAGTSRESTHGTLDTSPGTDRGSDDPAQSVGGVEENTADVPPHELGHKNPGHSGH